jgi:hypothetical protein
MARLNLKIPEALADDLTAVSELGKDTLARLGKNLQLDGQCIIKTADLRVAIANVVSAPSAPVVERVLLGLSGLRRQGHVTAAEVVSSLTQAIDALGWSVERRKLWDDVKDEFILLLENPSVVVTAKAVDLLYDYEHIFINAKILTDVRPVFDDSKETIFGATINQTLRVEYSNGSGDTINISMSLDDDDIESLLKSCQEALRKGRTVSKKVEESWGVPTLTVSGVNNDRR